MAADCRYRTLEGRYTPSAWLPSDLDFKPAEKFRGKAHFIFLTGPVCPESTQGLKDLVTKVFKAYHYTMEDSTFEDFSLDDGCFSRDKKVVMVLPGASGCSDWRFSAEQVAMIKGYAKAGLLKIIGVCAGAFYCSKFSEYHTRDHGVIKRERALDFFNGVCAGPAFPENEILPGKANIKLKPVVNCVDGVTERVVMNGGGIFLPSTLGDHKVLAKFDDAKLKVSGSDITAVACNLLSRDHKGTEEYSTFLISCHLEHDKLCLDAFLRTTKERLTFAEYNDVLSKRRNVQFRIKLFAEGLIALGFK